MNLDQEQLVARVAAYKEHGSERKACDALGISKTALHKSLVRAASLGLMGTAPVLPGYRLSKTTAVTNQDGDIVREFIQQRPDSGEVFKIPAGHTLKGVSALVGADGRVIQEWQKTNVDAVQRELSMRAVFDGLMGELVATPAILRPSHDTNELLLNQYTVTDNHLGALAWGEETGDADYDLKIAEQLLLDWFAAAVRQAPPARRGVLAQLGDLLDYDSFKSVTPEHGHVLDSDSRYPKMVRAAIRVLRRILIMLLEKHETVDVIMSDANHDPTAGVWLREMFAAFYEDEPRVTVDTTPGTYSFIEHGKVSLFYHHGHRKGLKDVDSTFVGRFREVYGRTKFSYGHMGHFHKDELFTTNLMKVERHATLAAPTAYSANAGHVSDRSAKHITYHMDYGEVGRGTLTPEMVAGAHAASKMTAANDNQPKRAAA